MNSETLSIKGISPASAPPAEVSVTHGNKPDPEVSPKQSRRRFTAQYKLRILHDIDASSQQGHIGAILRREGLYYSNIREWRQQRDQGIPLAIRQHCKLFLWICSVEETLGQRTKESSQYLSRAFWAMKMRL